MSWDADLIDDRTGVSVGEWNYTHNTSRMIYVVLDDAGCTLPPDPTPCHGRDSTTGEWTFYPEGRGAVAWWKHLSGMTGPAGAQFLDRIIRGLEADPARFEALNPPNGWGDYESLVKVLTDMRNSVPEWSTTWVASG